MSNGTWAASADRVLATLFRLGQPAPSKEAVRDAYPFGERRYFPYKIWLERVKAFRAAHAKGLAGPFSQSPRDVAKRNAEAADRETGDLFAGGAS